MYVRPLTVELSKRWIAALRSGEYKQTSSCLRKGDCFCAIGVLCNIVDKGYWKEASDIMIGEYYQFGGFSISNTGPYATIVDRLGGGESVHEYVLDKVTTMNDKEGKSFNEIADWLENYWGN